MNVEISKARELSGMPLIEFQRELAKRQIPVLDDLDGFESEVAQLMTSGDL
jgi:predicted HTH domain antitoxin